MGEEMSDRALPLDMMRTNSVQMNVVDEAGRMWYIRADVRPLAPDREYGVHLACGSEPTQLFAEVMCYFFPLGNQ